MERMSQTNCSDTVNTLSTTHTSINDDSNQDYDSAGAVQYIVCTIIVYSVFGVFCTLLVRVRRSRSPDYILKDQDDAVEKYLKLERDLRFESDKQHMRNEIQRHAESIARFEEKLRLLEEEKQREIERLAAIKEAERINRLTIKTDKQRKLSFSFLPSRKTKTDQKHRKMSLAESTLGKIGLSFLFVQADEGNVCSTSGSPLEEVEEESETVIDEEAVEGRIAAPANRNASSELRIKVESFEEKTFTEAEVPNKQHLVPLIYVTDVDEVKD